MFDAYVDWIYEAMLTEDHGEFEAALTHAAKSLGEAGAREVFVEAHDMLEIN